MAAPLVGVGLIALAAASSLVLGRLSKLLVIPAMLVGGLLLGPNGTGALTDERFLNGASDVGLVLLLFYTSLFAHPKALQRGGRIALPLALYDLVLNFAAAYWIGALFHWDLESRLILMGVLTTSSTGAILKILSDEGRLLGREGNVLVALLWFEDLAFIGYYMFLNGRLGFSSDLSGTTLVLSLALFGAYLLLLAFSREALWRVPQTEVLVPLVTGLGLVGAYLGSLAGLPIVGAAFTTGLVLSGSRGAEFVQKEAPYLREIAAAVFFFAFGSLIDPHVTWRVLPLAAAALGGIVLTEFLFLPLVARLLGLTPTESFVLGSSLLARGGKSAAFARLGSGPYTPLASELQSVSGLLTILLTPLSPLLVRAIVWIRRREPAGAARRSREVLSSISRRVLAPGDFAQRNPANWVQRLVLVEWLVLPALLGLLGSLVAFPYRWIPIGLGLLLLRPAYHYAAHYFRRMPGTPGNTFDSRGKSLPGLDTYLTPLLIFPCLLALLLPILAPLALLAFPIAAVCILLFLLLLPHRIHPVPRAPAIRRALPRRWGIAALLQRRLRPHSAETREPP